MRDERHKRKVRATNASSSSIATATRVVINHAQRRDVSRTLVMSLYSAGYVPLALCMPRTQWPGYLAFDHTLDAIFMLDILIRCFIM